MKLLALCLLALTVGGNADGGLGLDGLVYAPGHASADYYAYPAYAFEYAVKDPHTGDNKAQWEKRDGDVVKGAYSLVEPDGSVRVVEYYADDKTGFNAVVKRLGPNLHPIGPVAAPIYKAPIPVLGHGNYAPITVGPVAELRGLSAAPLITGPIHGGAISSAAIYKAPLVKTIAPAPIISQPILPIIKEPLLHGPPAHGPFLGLERGPIGLERGHIGLERGPYGLERGPIGLERGPIGLERGPIGLERGHIGLERGPIGLERGHIGLERGPIELERDSLLGLKEGPYLGPFIKEGPILPGPIIKSGPILSHLPWGYNSGHGDGHGPLLAPASLIKAGPHISETWPILPGPSYKSAPIVDLPYGVWDKGLNGPIGPIGAGIGDGLLGKGQLLSGWGWDGLKH